MMTPQEIAQIAKTTALVKSTEVSAAMGGIEESLKQMSKGQLAEVLAAVTLPEDYSPPDTKDIDLRMVILVWTTRCISEKLLEDWGNESESMDLGTDEIEAIFSSNPFLLRIVSGDAESAAEWAKREFEQMVESEEEERLRLRAAKLFLLAGQCWRVLSKFKAAELSG